MNPTDTEIETLIRTTKLMGDALAMDGKDARAEHVYNAMLDLIRARGPQVAAQMSVMREAAAKGIPA